VKRMATLKISTMEIIERHSLACIWSFEPFAVSSLPSVFDNISSVLFVGFGVELRTKCLTCLGLSALRFRVI